MHENSVEFEVWGDYALFSDPITRIGGEKFSYQVPTYEALKGILHSIYWKPTIIWIIDKVRIMNPIQTETKGIRTIKYKYTSEKKKNDLSYYTYLKDVNYKVKAHFIWNENRMELKPDRNENKHHNITKRMIAKGGRRDIFLGTRECQGYVRPTVFDDGDSVYDSVNELDFGILYHGITYADEAYDEQTKGKMTVRLKHIIMKNGIIYFTNADKIKKSCGKMISELQHVYGSCIQRPLHEMKIKPFGKELNNIQFAKELEKEVE